MKPNKIYCVTVPKVARSLHSTSGTRIEIMVYELINGTYVSEAKYVKLKNGNWDLRAKKAHVVLPSMITVYNEFVKYPYSLSKSCVVQQDGPTEFYFVDFDMAHMVKLMHLASMRDMYDRALANAHEKFFQINIPEEDIAAFKEKYPEYDL